MGTMWIVGFVIQWILVLLLAVLMVGVLRYLSFVQRNIHLVMQYSSRFDQGDRISHFKLPNLEGLPVLSKTLLEGSQRTILLFLSPSCNGCDAVISYLASFAKDEGGLKKFGWSIVTVYTGPRTSREAVEKHIDPLLLDEVTVLIDEQGSISQQYDFRSFPVGLAIDHSGRVVDQASRSMTKWLRQTLQSSEFSQQNHLPLSARNEQ